MTGVLFFILHFFVPNAVTMFCTVEPGGGGGWGGEAQQPGRLQSGTDIPPHITGGRHRMAFLQESETNFRSLPFFMP